MLDMLALGIIVPVLPRLIVQFEGGDMAKAAMQTGVFGFIFAAMQFFFAPVIGSASDHFGRRPVILLSNFGLGCDYLLMALAPSLSWLFVGRIISGITCASFPTASAYVADVVPADQRAAKLGMLSASFGLGFIIGPAVGGLLGGMGLRYPFYAAAALSLANALYGFFILPESLPPERRSGFHFRKANPLGSLELLRSHPVLLGLASAIFLYYIAHESLPSMFVLYTDYRYHWGEGMTGMALAAVGVCSTIVSAVLITATVKTFGEKRTLFAGLLFGIAGFAVYAAAPNTAWFLAGCPLISMWGLTTPPMQSLMTRCVGTSDQGKLQGALGSLFGVAGMIGPIVFTEAFAAAIGPQWNLPGFPYWLAALLLTGSLLLVTAAIARAPLPASSPLQP